jgi:hypothetical protein
MAAGSELNERISNAAAAVVRNGYLGGELQAAFRQGFNELGAALKAFPDSLQVEEPGAAWNPLYRDMPGNDRPNVHGGPEPMKEGAPMKNDPPMPTPSQVIDNPKAYLPEQQGNVMGQQQQDNAMAQDKGSVHGNGSQTPTPSQVIDNPKAYMPEQQGQQQGNVMGQQQQDNAMGQDTGSVHGNGGQTPTPSQVIDNPQAYLQTPEQQPGHEQQHEHGRGM